MIVETRRRKMKESQIQSNIIKHLVKKGAYVVNGIYTKAGIPDLMGIYKGKGFGIEVKTPATKTNTTKLQEYNLMKIQEAEGYSCVAWSIDEVDELLDLMDKS